MKKSRWIKFFKAVGMVLAMCLLMSVASCTTPPSEEKTPEDTDQTPAKPQVVLAEGGVAKYVIIRSDLTDSNSPETTLSLQVKKALQSVSGAEFELKTDWENKNDNAEIKEILIGKTNRAESAAAIAEIPGEDEYLIRVTGNKIVIVGNGELALTEAINYFLNQYAGWYAEDNYTQKQTLSMDEDAAYAGKWTVPVYDEEPWLADIVCAPNRATKILLLDAPGGDNSLTLATLQGLAAANSTTQILFRSGSWSKYLESIKDIGPDGFGAKVLEKNAAGQAWSVATLLEEYSSMLEGYILCDTGDESVNVAITLAHYLKAVVVTPSNVAVAEKAGLSMVLDVTEYDDAWLRESKYFDMLVTDVAVEQPANMAPRLVDYAVMAGCYINFYNGNDAEEHAKMFDFLDDGAIVIGWNNTLGEYDTVLSYSRLNACLIPADHACNLSTLSGFNRAGTVNDAQYATTVDGKVTNEARHTVCFVMSDGDNLQWMVNDFTSGRWYGSELRGLFPMTWGIPAMLGDLAHPMFDYIGATQTALDEIIMQLSGLGYTFPSKWDSFERENMAERLAEIMSARGMKYMNLLDDKGFTEENLGAFLKQDGIEGIFYTDYANYAGYKGEIKWVNGKPAVSARYRLWDIAGGSPEEIANSINNAPTDVRNASSYSFIIVHAWSGVDSNGNFGSGGSSMEAVDALMMLLDADVDVVSASEFMARINRYLK